MANVISKLKHMRTCFLFGGVNMTAIRVLVGLAVVMLAQIVKDQGLIPSWRTEFFGLLIVTYLTQCYSTFNLLCPSLTFICCFFLIYIEAFFHQDFYNHWFYNLKQTSSDIFCVLHNYSRIYISNVKWSIIQKAIDQSQTKKAETQTSDQASWIVR